LILVAQEEERAAFTGSRRKLHAGVEGLEEAFLRER